MKEEQGTIVSIEHFNEESMPNTGPIQRDDLPVLATRDLVLFPNITAPISIGRESSMELIKRASEKRVKIGIICQRDPQQEYPQIPNDLHEYGVTADIVKIIELPDDTKAVIVQAHDRIKITGPGKGELLPGCASVAVELLAEVPFGNEREEKEMVSVVKETTMSLIAKSGDMVSPDVKFNIQNITDSMLLINLVSSRSPIDSSAKIEMLAANSMFERASILLRELNICLEKADILNSIKQQTSHNLSAQQRQMFLMSQMETIQQEINGGVDPEIEALNNRFKGISNPPAKFAEVFNREIKRLERLNTQSPDYSVLYTYLDILLGLPWEVEREVNRDFAYAERILNESHSGLEKVKERILEQIAVSINSGSNRSPIICLVGAPGVGKTSLGISIARALNRDFTRISLGGLHDESEIRGHRRTYIGAMPGRIISGIQKCGSRNPVILLDEIDKISSDFRGDPQSALLEVLDPEQNKRFHDNYIDIDFDLSDVMFITTANTLSTISRPLLDRMEVIEISGYLLEEKIDIAMKHSIPRIINELAMTKRRIKFTPEAVKTIIENYTSESGVRQLENMIATVLRRLLLKRMRGEKTAATIKPEHISAILGMPRYRADQYEGNDQPGVVTGLAWTSVGGTILYIESSISPSKESKLTLTGSLGDVMKESAVIARQYILAHAEDFGVDRAKLESYSIHVHVPEGATPKDGPSAGITMLTSMVSAYTVRKVKPSIAMTGEMTLRGKVLPVGGIKEKILAAKRAGVNTIFLSIDNKKDVDDIKKDYLDGLTFVYVRSASEVINAALEEAAE